MTDPRADMWDDHMSNAAQTREVWAADPPRLSRILDATGVPYPLPRRRIGFDLSPRKETP